MQEIIKKCRALINDLPANGIDVFKYESIISSKAFNLSEPNIDASSIIVYKNGELWENNNYEYSPFTGKITIIGEIKVGDVLEICYNYYRYSNTELIGFIKAALSYLVVEKYNTFKVNNGDTIFPTPNEEEEQLIAIIAAILIKGDVVSYRTPEISISFERGESKEKKIKNLIRQFKKTKGILDYFELK